MSWVNLEDEFPLRNVIVPEASAKQYSNTVGGTIFSAIKEDLGIVCKFRF